MNWLEVSLEVCGRDIDLLCDRLQELGAGGLVVEDESDFENFLDGNKQYWDYVDEDFAKQLKGVSRIKFYLSEDENGFSVLERIKKEFDVSIKTIEDSDWENNWKEYYNPIEIGEKLIIVPAWQQAPDGQRTVLRLDPGLIFGTGSHATTRMCLKYIESIPSKGKRFLDIGCGSGILGIAAKLLGGNEVIGCDVDPKAPDVALENASLNGIFEDSFKIYSGDILKDMKLQNKLGVNFDVVLMNIVADVIISLSSTVPRFLAEDGFFICSGVIEGRQQDVKTALEAAGFEILEESCEEQWHAFICKMKK